MKKKGDTIRYMSMEEMAQVFATVILPYVMREYESDGVMDIPARNEAWNNWADWLHRNGDISDEAVNDWSCPFTP